jgi:hypothetical protein
MATGALIGAVVVAGVGTMMSYRQQSKAQHTQQDQWAKQEEMNEEQYGRAVAEWEKAVSMSEEQYERDIGLWEERREFYSDIAENPMDTEVWKTFERAIEGKYEQGVEAMQHQLASRGGMVGGEAEEAFGGLEMHRQRDLANLLSGIIMRAEQAYQVEGAKQPQWQRPGFLASPQYSPQYGEGYIPATLDLSGLSSSLYLLGKEWGDGTTSRPGTTGGDYYEFDYQTEDQAALGQR